MTISAPHIAAYVMFLNGVRLCDIVTGKGHSVDIAISIYINT